MCSYHGWTYDCGGKLTKVGEGHSNRQAPKVTLRTYPVDVRYGLIWVFFGDKSLMAERPLPRIPVLDGAKPWVTTPLDYRIKCHPTAIVNNIMDSTHVQSLHRTFRTRSMIYGKVTGCESERDTVTVTHDITLNRGGILRWLLPPLKVPSQYAVYDYPYLRVSVGDVYKLWNFMLPMGPRELRLFIVPCADRLKIPGTPWEAPDFLIDPFTNIATRLLAHPLFFEDVWAMEAEQQGYDAHHDARSIDPHPAIQPSYELTVRKWEEHLARERASRAVPAARLVQTPA